MIRKIENVLSRNRYLYNIGKRLYEKTYGKINFRRKNRNFKKNGKDTLCSFDDACKEIEVVYWLGFGTLLGAIREKDFIQHDLDIDVGMMLENYDPRHEVIFRKYGFTKIKSFLIDEGKYGREETYEKNGIFLDIFYFSKTDILYCHTFSKADGLSAEKTKEKYGGYVIREHSFPLDSFVTYSFLDRDFLIPSDYDSHLRAHYGEYMVKDKSFSYKRANNHVILKDKIGVLLTK